MKARSNTINGIDLQQEYVSIAQYSPDDHSVGLVAIQPIQADRNLDFWGHIELELKGLRGKFKFSNPEVVCSLPSEFAVVKRMFVGQDEAAPREVIEWELGQQIVGSLEDYAVDFLETGSQIEENAREYLAVAYRREAVSRVESIMKGLKLNPLVVDLDSFALINVFEANYGERISAPALIIHGEGERTKFILTQNGQFLDFDCICHDSGTLEPQRYTDRLETEAKRFLSFNASVAGTGPMGIYLAGSLFSQPGYLDTAVEKIEATELLYPFRNIACHVGVDESKIRSYAAQLAVAVGLALRKSD